MVVRRSEGVKYCSVHLRIHPPFRKAKYRLRNDFHIPAWSLLPLLIMLRTLCFLLKMTYRTSALIEQNREINAEPVHKTSTGRLYVYGYAINILATGSGGMRCHTPTTIEGIVIWQNEWNQALTKVYYIFMLQFQNQERMGKHRSASQSGKGKQLMQTEPMPKKRGRKSIQELVETLADSYVKGNPTKT